MATKTKPVFTAVEEVREWELENYLVTLKDHLMCPKWVKACSIDTSKHDAANVTFSQALQFVREALKSGLDTCPLREVIDRCVGLNGVKISVGGAVISHEGETVELKSVAGYFVPQKRLGDVLNNWVGDAVAFQHTPLSKKDVGVIDRAVTPAIEKSLHLSEQSFNVGVPSQWSTDAVDNADALINMFAVKSTNYYAIRYGSDISSKWAVHGQRVVVTAPPQVQDLIYENDNGTRVINIPCAVLQPPRVPVEELGFYKNLAAHRAVRGADKNSRSRLTSGFYLGSMSRALDQTLWNAIDILAVMDASKRQSIYFATAPNYNVVNCLMANNKTVYVQSHKHLGITKFNVYRLPPNNYNNGLVYVDGYFGAQAPLVDKKGKVIGQLKEEFIKMFTSFQAFGGFAITHVYLRDYMSEYMEYIVPSVHAHAGHVILCNTKLHPADFVTLRELFARASMANKYKTAFPVRRVPFATQDRRCPHFLIHQGIVLGTMADEDDSLEYQDAGFMADTAEVFNAAPLIFVSKQIAPVVLAPPMVVHLPVEVVGVGKYDEHGKEIKDEGDEYADQLGGDAVDVDDVTFEEYNDF